MKTILRIVLFLSTCVLLFNNAHAQILKPVHWSYAAKKTSPTDAVIFIKATIDKGWHIYSQSMADGGPVKTSFNFLVSKAYTLIGKTSEPKAITKLETAFSHPMKVGYFENTVTFQQKVQLNTGKAIVKGKLEYATCNDHTCLPPETISFNIDVH